MKNTRTSSRCRTCNETSANFYALLDAADRDRFPERTLGDLLLEITKIDIRVPNPNTLPLQICGNCSRKLKSAYSFAQQAQRINEELLSAYLKQNLPENAPSKQVDCLLEAPIDIPAQAFLQIKMETDESVSNALFTMDGYSETSPQKVTEEETPYREDMKQEEEQSLQSAKQEEIPRSSHAEKLDPITVEEENWNCEDTNDPDFNNSDAAESTNDTDDAEYTPLKRRRGRPRSAKKISRQGQRYKCDVCSKTFAWLKDLERHTKTHFGIPEHECEYCNRMFLRKDKLMDHLKRHAKYGKELPERKSPRQQRLGALRPAVRRPEWKFGEYLFSDQPFRMIECKLCQAKFQTTTALRTHLTVHADSMTLEQLSEDCDVVKELFPQMPQLDDVKTSICEDIAQEHLTKYYAIVNEHGYELCLSDSDSEVIPHSYQCELCDEVFPRKYKIFAHMKEQHAHDQLPYKCKVCKLDFVCAQMHELHTRTQCRSKEKKYRCLKCPAKFMWVENLELHKCSNRFNTPEYKAKLPYKRDIVKCGVCAKTFLRLKDLKRHQETHTPGGSVHECYVCFQRFLKAENLRHHMCLEHALKRQIHCGLCELKFDRLAQLRQHLPVHADGRTNVSVADAQYFKIHFPQGCAGREDELAGSISSNFATNQLTSYYSAVDESGNELDLYDSESDNDFEGSPTSSTTATASYSCELCEEVFTRRKRLLLHQYSEHADTESLPHKCSECQQEFVCRALLEQHLSRDCGNTLKKYHCDKCSARFTWQENLELHTKLKHIDMEQQHGRQLANKLQCEQCDKVFIWPKDLTRHKRVHMPDDEKFECPLCDRKFNRKDNMHSHMKTHGAEAAASILKKDATRKPSKAKGIDLNLCKPHGCKCIQCMICLSKHSKIADLRTHLRTHQYVVSLAQRQDSISDISQQLYPEEPVMSEEQLIERIIADISGQELERFYSITNEVGYELSLSSSETDSDSDSEMDNEGNTTGRCGYKCDLCIKSFTRKYKIFEHQCWEHAWQEAPHVCSQCNARFLSEDLLQLHYKHQCKNVQKRFVCRKCPLRFMWKENLKMHVNTKHAEMDEKKLDAPTSFDCIECNRSFRMQKDLTRHMVVHRKDACVFKCLFCPRKFYRKENLHMHVKRHEITPEDIVSAECYITATNQANGAKDILCRVCNLRFERTSDLRLHLLQSANNAHPIHYELNSSLNYSITNKLGFEVEINDSDTDDDDAGGSETGPKRPKYVCEICNLTCKRKFEVAQHQRSVHKHEQLPFKCDKCVFRTVCNEILVHHMRTQCYNVEKQHQCQQCSFKFMWPENLVAHVSLIHPPQAEMSESAAPGDTSNASSAERIFQCDKCDRKYNRKDRLTAHIKKMHMGSSVTVKSENTDNSLIDPVTGERGSVKKPIMEKKFLCAFCGRAVTSSSNLIIHMRRHTGEKPFKCEFCDMAFPRSSDLQCHRRTHTGEKPHKCTVCDKAFSRSYKLQTHMRIHSGERPYKCTYCEKSFTQSNDLTLHVRRHTGERPYVCGICGERFIQGTALKNHRTMQGHYEAVEPRRSILEQF